MTENNILHSFKRHVGIHDVGTLLREVRGSGSHDMGSDKSMVFLAEKQFAEAV